MPGSGAEATFSRPMQVQSHRSDARIRGRYKAVAVRHTPAGAAVYVAEKWHATFESEAEANAHADHLANRPWHVRAD